MSKRPIYARSFKYELGAIYVGFFFRNYYKNICILGKENIPQGQAFLLAPNHQNALIDALAIINCRIEQTVFMARADIFGIKPIIDKILFFLKIMPIYRIRDGFGNLGKNEEYFQKATEVLSKHIPLCLFPEGRHNDKHQLLPLVKGMFRIAVQAKEQLGEEVLQIVPVGIDYENYDNEYYDLLLNFGEPIPVEQYYQTYLEKPVEGMNQLREVVAEKIRKQMHHIESTVYYDLFYDLSRQVTPTLLQSKEKKSTVENAFFCRKEISAKLDRAELEQPEEVRQIAALHNELSTKKKNIRVDSIDAKKSMLPLFAKGLFYLATAPLFIVSYLLNALPFFLLKLISKKIKDTQFKSSFKFTVSLILFPLYYLLLFIPLCIILPKAVYALALPILGYLSNRFFYWYRFCIRRDLSLMRFFLLPRKSRKELLSLKSELHQKVLHLPS